MSYLGGVGLGSPIVVKLIPALPVAVLLLQRSAAALAPSRSPRSLSRATPVTFGLAFGILLSPLPSQPPVSAGVRPAPSPHLEPKVVTSPDIGREVFVEVDDDSDQSFGDPAHLLSARIRGRAIAGANPVIDQVAHRQSSPRHGDERASAGRSRHRRVGARYQVIVLALLMAWAGRGAPERYLGSGRDLWPGLSCDRPRFPGGLEPLLRTLAAVRPALPPWLMQQGQLRAARAVPAVPWG